MKEKSAILLTENYDALKLTKGQAEKIYQFENDRPWYQHKLSDWEQWEYERAIFRGMLSDDQFKTYEKLLAAKIKKHEKDLMEDDEERKGEIEYYKDLLYFAEDSLLADLKKEAYEGGYLDLNPDKAKIIFVRSEYQLFWIRAKEKMIRNHFRYNRNFQPKVFQSLLLKSRLSDLLPDYWAFKRKAHDSVKAVIHYLKEDPKFPTVHEKLLARKWNELRAVHEKSLKQSGSYFKRLGSFNGEALGRTDA